MSDDIIIAAMIGVGVGITCGWCGCLFTLRQTIHATMAEFLNGPVVVVMPKNNHSGGFISVDDIDPADRWKYDIGDDDDET